MRQQPGVLNVADVEDVCAIWTIGLIHGWDTNLGVVVTSGVIRGRAEAAMLPAVPWNKGLLVTLTGSLPGVTPLLAPVRDSVRRVA